jgi:hypothetical protein
MRKPLEWEKIDISTHFNNEATSFHVNMKNFVCMHTVNTLSKNNDNSGYYEKFNCLFDLMCNGDIDEKYLIERDKIIPFVYSIREVRKLQEVIGNNFGVSTIEYLRFYPYKGKYVVTNDCELLDYKNLTSEILVGEDEINLEKETSY